MLQLGQLVLYRARASEQLSSLLLLLRCCFTVNYSGGSSGAQTLMQSMLAKPCTYRGH